MLTGTMTYLWSVQNNPYSISKTKLKGLGQTWRSLQLRLSENTLDFALSVEFNEHVIDACEYLKKPHF